ncbi:MAG TPA: hypothetical protein VMU18_12490 [Rhodoblastus sp.]|nr:hypothetical protein [Rhodoblastus sp.]
MRSPLPLFSILRSPPVGFSAPTQAVVLQRFNRILALIAGLAAAGCFLFPSQTRADQGPAQSDQASAADRIGGARFKDVTRANPAPRSKTLRRETQLAEGDRWSGQL